MKIIKNFDIEFSSPRFSRGQKKLPKYLRGKRSHVMYALSSQFSLLSVCGRSCFDVTAQLFPGLHFARFVTQPEVKVFCDLHIRIPCRFDQVNKKLSLIYTLSNAMCRGKLIRLQILLFSVIQ